MTQYLNSNDVFILIAPECTEEDRLAAAELQEALGDKIKVVLFTSPVGIDTVSVAHDYLYDGFPTGPVTAPADEVVVEDSDNILNFPKTI